MRDFLQADYDLYKAIKETIHHQTRIILETVTKEYDAYTLVETVPDRLTVSIRINENFIQIFNIIKSPHTKKWIISLPGGDFKPTLLTKFANLCEFFNQKNIKDIEKWYK